MKIKVVDELLVLPGLFSIFSSFYILYLGIEDKQYFQSSCLFGFFLLIGLVVLSDAVKITKDEE
jgi:hypothetical protein